MIGLGSDKNNYDDEDDGNGDGLEYNFYHVDDDEQL